MHQVLETESPAAAALHAAILSGPSVATPHATFQTHSALSEGLVCQVFFFFFITLESRVE